MTVKQWRKTMARFRFNLLAKKQPTNIRKQVSSLSAFHELFPTDGVAKGGYSEITIEGAIIGSKMPRNGLTRETCDFLSTVPNTLIFEIGVGERDDAFGMTTYSNSRLVVQLQEPFNQKAFDRGTLKMTVLEYKLNGVKQDITKPIDLQPLIDLKRSLTGFRLPFQATKHPSAQSAL
jgi:hypothetical protein